MVARSEHITDTADLTTLSALVRDLMTAEQSAVRLLHERHLSLARLRSRLAHAAGLYAERIVAQASAVTAVA